jgi:hypothetical protein
MAPTTTISKPARIAAANSADHMINGSPNWLPISIRAPSPSIAPVGNSPTMVPIKAAATATFRLAKK